VGCQRAAGRWGDVGGMRGRRRRKEESEKGSWWRGGREGGKPLKERAEGLEPPKGGLRPKGLSCGCENWKRESALL